MLNPDGTTHYEHSQLMALKYVKLCKQHYVAKVLKYQTDLSTTYAAQVLK